MYVIITLLWALKCTDGLQLRAKILISIDILSSSSPLCQWSSQWKCFYAEIGPTNFIDQYWHKKECYRVFVCKIFPDLKVKNVFWTLSANMINKPLLGYCVCIELYTRTVSSERARFSLVSILDATQKTMKISANKGIGQYFPNTL